MMNVLVIDANKKACNPVPPVRARLLLKKGKAAVFRQEPFTIILKEGSSHETILPLQLKIALGNTSLMALIDDTTDDILLMFELNHRSFKDIPTQSQSPRKRYRAVRLNNRKRMYSSVAIESRVAQIGMWVAMLKQFSHIANINIELTGFYSQHSENPEIMSQKECLEEVLKILASSFAKPSDAL